MRAVSNFTSRSFGSDLATRAPDAFASVPVDDAVLDVVRAFLHIEELQGSKQHPVDTHAPKSLPVQLVAFEADQFGHAKAERALEDTIVANEDQRLADGQKDSG